ncbi:unnamed protein product [Caenorhabditis auriculariae]|uniref:Uncharacterized protein n=1 Tax=Caenorhabditis auriculariae TaxID=2777116 RepID=A0A8S1GRL6_9PELO|nr:unnamed protein product [Caenorhabditis auriculariae]
MLYSLFRFLISLLLCKSSNRQRETKKQPLVLHEAEFVSWRGLLTRIAVTPYDQRDSWRFRAARRLGVVFLNEEETEEKKKKKENISVREKHMCFWGFKFEQYMTVSDKEEMPDTKQPVSNREEFANVIRSNLRADDGGNLKMLYSAEIDCLDDQGLPVELKTHKGALEGWFWETKSLKWWMQSFLVAVPRIVVGHRNDQGIVRTVDSIATEALVKRGKWSGSVCMRFLSRILSEVRNLLVEEGSACTVEFKSDGQVAVVVFHVLYPASAFWCSCPLWWSGSRRNPREKDALSRHPLPQLHQRLFNGRVTHPREKQMVMNAVKAEDIEHVLRDGVALLPGGRCRAGKAVLVFPSREQPVNPDHLRNVLLYLLTVTADAAREQGFLVVIDMRGKQTWTNVRPILKALNSMSDAAAISQVFIIKPDKFWEKQKAQISLGSWRFEVQMISPEGLTKYVDMNQLPRVIGGSHPYDHDDWLEIRLDLEKWIWNISEVMGGLDQVRKEICECEQPVDVPTSEVAVNKHAVAKKTIFAIPVDKIENDAKKICDRISSPKNFFQNPDLVAVIPHISNLVESLRKLKSEVFSLWDSRRGELEKLYQMKLFEQDAEKMIDLVRSYCTVVDRNMGDVGVCETDVIRLSADFESFQQTVLGAEVNVSQVITRAQRILSTGSTGRSNIEVGAMRLQDEWRHLNDSIKRRQIILSAARAFFISSQKYFAEVPEWTAKPGVNPSDVMLQPADALEDAIRRHDTFWVRIEEIYAQAFDDGTKVTQAMKSADAEDNVAREQMGRLTRAHKQLHEKWRERKVLLHHLLAMIAFETDVKLVVDWLDQHGEPYLCKNVNIGENDVQAKTLQKNHANFKKVAANTYDNVKKLYQVYKNIVDSGNQMCDAEKMRKMQTLMSDLEVRINHFTVRVETRYNLLRLSVLFHTHYAELTTWFLDMKRKYEEKVVDTDVDVCEMNKERWVAESDGTAQAYAITMGDGRKLLTELQSASNTCDIDYSVSIAHTQRLMDDIDEKNASLSNEWAPQRIVLQIGLKYAQFALSTSQVLIQIQGWEEDMREMVHSDTFIDKVEAVSQFHHDNQEKVRVAVINIRKTAKELQLALHQHRIVELTTRGGQKVMDLIYEHTAHLERSERRVMKVAEKTTQRIEAARDFCACRKKALNLIALCEQEERQLLGRASIPLNGKEAEFAKEMLKDFHKKIEAKENPFFQSRLSDLLRAFFKQTYEMLGEAKFDRDLIAQLNELVMRQHRRLFNLCDERHKLLNAAVTYYKSYEEGVVPVVQHFSKDYSQPYKDWCAQCPSESSEDKAQYIANLLAKHVQYKERFIKGCVFSQKNADILLRYIQRTNISSQEKMAHQDRILQLKDETRDRQSKYLGLWMNRKLELDLCHNYVLLVASSKHILDWLKGEGEQKLMGYRKFVQSGDDQLKKKDEFSSFKIEVKEKRNHAHVFLKFANEMKDKDPTSQHAEDVDRCIKELRDKFEKFSKRVAECDVVFRGDAPQSARNEFSLDRHSDSSIEEKFTSARESETKKMLEPMRELIKSERDYIDDIARCVHVYLKEYDDAFASNTLPLALRPLRKDIFSNIDRIYEFHSQKLLHELVRYEMQPEAVGASFTVWIDLLNELYTEYCVNKEQKNSILTMPEFKTFFDGIRLKHELEMHNEVGSLLIKPVQRITRYRLLMEQLLKTCTGNTDDLRDAYDVVLSVPRRVNDIIHYNCLDLKDSKADVLGPFVMQDTLTVWEPRAYFKGRGKERQVFLFELSIVFAKRIEIVAKSFKYVVKGKPIPLSEVSVVEHVEGDTSRFGLRVGTVASNDNRTDLRASSETVKVSWVRKIRELTQGLLSINLGVSSALTAPSSTVSGPRSVSTRSVVSSSSGNADRLSQDVDLSHNRHSIQSSDSAEQASEAWYVVSDFEGQAEGHIKVSKGERVEIVEDQATDFADYVQVVVCEEPSRHGLVPTAILVPERLVKCAFSLVLSAQFFHIFT